MSCYPGLVPAVGLQPWARAWNPARWWTQGQISDRNYNPKGGGAYCWWDKFQGKQCCISPITGALACFEPKPGSGVPAGCRGHYYKADQMACAFQSQGGRDQGIDVVPRFLDKLKTKWPQPSGSGHSGARSIVRHMRPNPHRTSADLVWSSPWHGRAYPGDVSHTSPVYVHRNDQELVDPELGYTTADLHREVYGTDTHPMDPDHPRWKTSEAQYPDPRTVYPSRGSWPPMRNPQEPFFGPWNYPTNHYGVPAMSFPTRKAIVGKRKLSFIEKLFKRKTKNPVMTVVRGRAQNPSFWKGTQPGSPLDEATTANVLGDGYGSQTRPWVVWNRYWGNLGLQWQAPYAGYEYPTRQPGTWPPDYAPGVVATPTTNEWDMWLMYNPQLMQNFAQWYGPESPLFTNQHLAVRAWNHRRSKSWKPWKRNQGPVRQGMTTRISSSFG